MPIKVCLNIDFTLSVVFSEPSSLLKKRPAGAKKTVCIKFYIGVIISIIKQLLRLREEGNIQRKNSSSV